MSSAFPLLAFLAVVILGWAARAMYLTAAAPRWCDASLTGRRCRYWSDGSHRCGYHAHSGRQDAGIHECACGTEFGTGIIWTPDP